jgi:NMT1-like family
MRVFLQSLVGFLAALLLSTFQCVAQGPSTTFDVAQAGPRSGPTAAAAGEQGRAAAVNNWTVGIAGGFFEGTFIRFAAELAKALDDDDNLRILPIVSYGGNRNIHDLLYLKGVDIAIAYTDSLELYKKSGQYRDIERRINYISELLVGEFYVYGRPEIKRLQDLDGKKVSLGLKGSSATTTAPIVFERLGIRPEFLYLSGPVAHEKMKAGEIAALASTGGKPNDLFVKLKPEPGFHFIPIEFSDKFSDYYLPCPLNHEDYPHLIPSGEKVDTLCMSAVLAVYNFPKESERYRRVERFIHYYFERFESLKQPSFHGKWKEINLAAKVPGWTRYWVAAEKLAAMPKFSAAKGPDIANRAPADAILPSTKAEQEALFNEFMAWREKYPTKR